MHMVIFQKMQQRFCSFRKDPQPSFFQKMWQRLSYKRISENRLIHDNTRDYMHVSKSDF